MQNDPNKMRMQVSSLSVSSSCQMQEKGSWPICDLIQIAKEWQGIFGADLIAGYVLLLY